MHATIKNGVIYISRPTVEKMWVRLGSLPPSARATALQMLSFLEQLQAGRNTILASAWAAEIIVAQFKHDLLEMNVVSSMSDFNSTTEDGCIFEVTTAEEYVAKVFVPEYLPSVMSVKSFLKIALDLQLPNLHEKLVYTLLKKAKLVPRATSHAGSVSFSPSRSPSISS
jgi:hypothetical protein